MTAKSPFRFLLVLGGAALVAQLAISALGARSLASEILAAFAVDLIAARFGAPWYGEGAQGNETLRRDLARGAAVAAVALIVALAVGLLTRAASVAGTGFSPFGLLLGTATALAGAVRREVLYRWIPLRAGRELASPRALGVFSILLGAAPVASLAPFRPSSVAVALAMGALSVTLVRRTGGLSASVAAHAVVLLVTGTLLSSILDVRWQSGALAPLDAASGPGAWILAIVLASATVLVARRPRPTV